MAKKDLNATTLLYPVPCVMVSCAGETGKPNIITVAWAGTVNSEPPMVAIGVRPSRHSYTLIKQTGEFVVNVPSVALAEAADFCGIKSGRDTNKFAAMNLTPAAARKLKKAPLIKEAPLNLECKVRQSLMLGTHELFIGEVVAVHADEEILNEKGQIDAGKGKLLVLSGDGYRMTGDLAALRGVSVKNDQ